MARPRLSPSGRAVTLAASIIGLAAAYFVAGKFGLNLAFVNTSTTAVWPPTGISLAALLLLGIRVCPGVLLGAFLTNITTTGDPFPSAGIAVGNTLEALGAAGRKRPARIPLFPGLDLGRLSLRPARRRDGGDPPRVDRRLGNAPRLRALRARGPESVAHLSAGVHGRGGGHIACPRRGGARRPARAEDDPEDRAAPADGGGRVRAH